jgi:DNA phosphorothioation-associated putative methyltransferase
MRQIPLYVRRMSLENRPGSATKFGKRVIDDLYVHLDYFESANVDNHTKQLFEASKELIDSNDLALCNVAKINARKKRVSFLQYLDFADEPFPTLNGAWTVDLVANAISLRSYAESLNPPILHRKELLVPPDHPSHEAWSAVTRAAEELGLFSSTTTIGFRENWNRLIAERGFTFQSGQFEPVGNLVEAGAEPSESQTTGNVQRHLTALSRSSLSAPVQLLIGHGLINPQTTVFDYGCGRGDDLRGLASIGIECSGWDPHYSSESPVFPADIVNLGFVVNVIEDPVERIEAIEKAYSIAKTALVISVMLASANRPGTPYKDGFLTARNTFQKYFSQDEFKDFLESVLGQDPIMIGPGIALVFRDQNAEQSFLLNRYRSSNVARRLVSARLSPKIARPPRLPAARVPKPTKSERELAELMPILESLWLQTLDLGRYPEPQEIPDLPALIEKLSLRRAIRLMSLHFDQTLLERAAKTRAEDIKLYFSYLQFKRKAPYKDLEPRLKIDIKYFFGDYKSANNAAIQLLADAARPEVLFDACKEASAAGLGWLNGAHSLQLHISLVERLPAVLRAYIYCGLILWDNVSTIQLIKIHIGSGKLTLLQYDDFDGNPMPSLIKRIKVNIRKLSYEVFDYQAPQYPPTCLLYKSRYMHEDMDSFAEQVAFDEVFDSTGVHDQFQTQPTLDQIVNVLSLMRLEVRGFSLVRGSTVPPLDQRCGALLSYRDFIECGETQKRLQIHNVPKSASTYNALYDLATRILDPIIDYYGPIKLTYGFSSSDLASKITGRIAPKIDQHASHECNRLGNPICDRLGAAVDFIVEDEDMLEVAQWVVEHTEFDRLYFYGRDRPIHLSFSEAPTAQVTVMTKLENGRQVPKTLSVEKFLLFTL